MSFLNSSYDIGCSGCVANTDFAAACVSSSWFRLGRLLKQSGFSIGHFGQNGHGLWHGRPRSLHPRTFHLLCKYLTRLSSQLAMRLQPKDFVNTHSRDASFIDFRHSCSIGSIAASRHWLRPCFSTASASRIAFVSPHVMVSVIFKI